MNAKILFLKWKKELHIYIKNIFQLKKILLKLLIIFSTALIVCLSTFLFREHILKKHYTSGTNFINLEGPIFNDGVSFSMFKNVGTEFVYFIQVTPTIIGMMALIFIKNWYTMIGVACVTMGGLSNVIDRMIPDVDYQGRVFNNTVVDYFAFNFSFGIFNIPDIFISIGFVVIVFSIITNLIISYKKDKTTKTNIIENAKTSSKL